MLKLTPGRVYIELDSPHYGGTYVANQWEVAIKLGRTHRQLATDVIDTWPEISQNVEARKWVRRQPKYILAIILSQI
jgi:hypothetical protein